KFKPADIKPWPEIVEHEAMIGRCLDHSEKGNQPEGKARNDHAAADNADRATSKSLLKCWPEEKINGRAKERQQYYPADEIDGLRIIHSLPAPVIRLKSQSR